MQKPAVTLMVRAARAGGNVLLRHMHKLDALNVVEKERMDYASEVDGLAEAEIVKELRKAGPEYAVLGEEGGHQPARGGRKAAPRTRSAAAPYRGSAADSCRTVAAERAGGAPRTSPPRGRATSCST